MSWSDVDCDLLRLYRQTQPDKQKKSGSESFQYNVRCL